MLDALKGSDYSEMLGVLSRLTLNLAPQSPFEEENAVQRHVDLRDQNVLSEIRGLLGLAQNDNSDQARDKIINFISDQISQVVLGGTSEQLVRARLGNKGTLRPDLYEISFGTGFEYTQGRGIRREHVKQALNYPDDVDHVLPESDLFRENGSFSLYVKHHLSDDPYKNFTLLVTTSRRGYEQSFIDAMRIYPTDVDISSAKQPLDLLKAFVDKYGATMKVGRQAGKFFFLVVIDKPRFAHNFQFFEIPTSENNNMLQSHLMFKDTGTTLEVSMAYAVNDTVYRRDLKKHGVQVKFG